VQVENFITPIVVVQCLSGEMLVVARGASRAVAGLGLMFLFLFGSALWSLVLAHGMMMRGKAMDFEV
jgi:hypothetical protein